MDLHSYRVPPCIHDPHVYLGTASVGMHRSTWLPISPYKIVYQAEFLSSIKYGLPALNAQVQSKQNHPYHRSAWKEASDLHSAYMVWATALRGCACLKIAELKNFARYDLCSVTCTCSRVLMRSWVVFIFYTHFSSIFI